MPPRAPLKNETGHRPCISKMPKLKPYCQRTAQRSLKATVAKKELKAASSLRAREMCALDSLGLSLVCLVKIYLAVNLSPTHRHINQIPKIPLPPLPMDPPQSLPMAVPLPLRHSSIEIIPTGAVGDRSIRPVSPHTGQAWPAAAECQP
jgi:hypothetical protein